MNKKVTRKNYSPMQERLLTYLLKLEKLSDDLDVPWDVEDFLGHRPAPTESPTVSRLLKNLSERGNIKLIDANSREGKRKRRRTTHIRLTESGRMVAQGIDDGFRVTQTTYSEQLSIPAKQYNAATFNKYLLTRELNAVDAALADETDDYTPYGFRGVEPGSKSKTKGEVQLYRHLVESALEVTEDDLRKMYEETNKVFYQIRDMFPTGFIKIEETER